MLTRSSTSFWEGIAWVVIIAASVEIALAFSCTPDTCPNSPVMAIFLGPDCTGKQGFGSLPYPWGICQNSYSSSTQPTFTDNYWQLAVYEGRDCGNGMEYPNLGVERFYFGSCINYVQELETLASPMVQALISSNIDIRRQSGPVSFMYLKNANQSFDSPQYPVVIPGVPRAHASFSECASLEDCESKGDFFVQQFNSECTVSKGFYVANVSSNACYRSNNGYDTSRCINEHTIENLMSFNADCSNPWGSIISGGLCYHNNPQNIYCTSSMESSDSKSQKPKPRKLSH